MEILIQKTTSGRKTKKILLKWFMVKAEKSHQVIHKYLSKKWEIFFPFYLKKLVPYYEIQAADKKDYRSITKLESNERHLINLEKEPDVKKPHHE